MQAVSWKGRRTVAIGVGAIVAMLLIAVMPAAAQGALGGANAAAGSLQVSINVSPSTVTVGTQQTFTAQVSGGNGPFTYVWSPIPPNCQAQPVQSWTCTLSSPGNFEVGVTVSNGTGSQGSATQSFQVTSSGNGGNGNGNGNGNNGSSNGNNSNGFNLSSFGPILIYGLIAGLVGFALLVALTVGVIMIAVTLRRRLPVPPKGGGVCAQCKSPTPAGAKFCPACAAPTAPTK
ncbi:MAG TPA: hypothetical protein VMH38_09960 [Thermoplasmata archaeon]|nr:hypothetical protein [Thermoplasmata archaeon]